jgi:hypothetical protein
VRRYGPTTDYLRQGPDSVALAPVRFQLRFEGLRKDFENPIKPDSLPFRGLPDVGTAFPVARFLEQLAKKG